MCYRIKTSIHRPTHKLSQSTLVLCVWPRVVIQNYRGPQTTNLVHISMMLWLYSRSHSLARSTSQTIGRLTFGLLRNGRRLDPKKASRAFLPGSLVASTSFFLRRCSNHHREYDTPIFWKQFLWADRMYAYVNLWLFSFPRCALELLQKGDYSTQTPGTTSVYDDEIV